MYSAVAVIQIEMRLRGFWIMQDATCHLHRVVVKRGMDAVRFIITQANVARWSKVVHERVSRCFQSHWWIEFNGIFQAQLLSKTDRYTLSLPQREIIFRARRCALFFFESFVKSEITIIRKIIITLSFLSLFPRLFINFILATCYLSEIIFEKFSARWTTQFPFSWLEEITRKFSGRAQTAGGFLGR